ncbi:pyridoxal phosphate-dependent aminotransferase [Flavobacterium sp. NG2]|uniref:pyridoxal phosphate-dependent aminotransferase n=1 Tax=Flavobacterium sp. NG2 TaxID=3097547 RepID=UPI002A804D38|nr:pyridoxal phosphate-dependent aminotransferase [Flavobacterium sp. NG2]WPR70224.1 pyridoxal phosphate-dependent aminotransferase [Flavobacterium sp. NG2]
MPNISIRGKRMPQSPIRKLAPYADIAVQKGHKVYHLNIGQPDIKSPELAIEALRNFELDIIEYGPSAGFDSYRKKLAKFYNDQDIDVNFEDIMITTGGSEALLFALGSIMDPGDEIIIPEPFYANYIAFSEESSATVVPVNTVLENGFALPSMDAFEKAITPKTKAILICNPSNPTGNLYSEDEIKQLGEIVKKHDLFLIADEVYRKFIYDGDEFFSVMNLVGLEQNVIMIDSVSKRYSMCGARIGCMVTQNKQVIATAMKFAQARLCPPTIGQIACEAAIATPQSYFDEVIAEYKERRDTLVAELDKIKGVVVNKPKAAFYCIVELPVDNTEDFAQWLLEKYDLNGETVMISPASGFYSTPGLGLNQVRIAYVLKKEDLIQAVHILKDAIQVYNKQKEINTVEANS